MRRAISLFFALCLAGCASLTPWTQLKSGEYKDGARDFSSVVPLDWMRFNQLSYFVMTRDGTVLDRIVVAREKNNAKLEFTKKVFTKEMTTEDLAEVEIDNLKAGDQIGKLEILSNKPAAIGGQEGFRLEYTYVITPGGLKIHGIEYGFRYKDWIYRVLFEAAAQHYFDSTLGDFQKFVDHFRLL